MLVQHCAARKAAIRADLATTCAGIVAGNGYCADYVRVYLAAARSAGLFCRQWAFSFDGFGGHGHTFVEVYDRERGRWSFIDVHNNVYAVLAGTDVPSTRLRCARALLATRRLPSSSGAPAPVGPGFPHFDKLLDYYRRGADEWYLWWGNDVDQSRTAWTSPPAFRASCPSARQRAWTPAAAGDTGDPRERASDRAHGRLCGAAWSRQPS